ncbi:MAG: tRNA uridine-5-carboxymethylaminomethyl(34) synthesis enzyme MnmG, partial [Armatimonadota bacterium]|nr:tRNA uridine-5-carboxymethylaminomethyl(34) synthesis enzyme MnmG [Armatimonadota bacterium]
EIGLVTQERWERFIARQELINHEMERLRKTFVRPSDKETLGKLGIEGLQRRTSLEELLRRPEIRYADILSLNGHNPNLPRDIREQIETQIKYEGYIRRQLLQVEQQKRLESLRIPPNFNYSSATSLSNEGREKLSRVQPASIGQASRIPGVTPADISLLMVLLSKYERGGS